MDSADWPQVLTKTMEKEKGSKPVLERKAKPAEKDQSLKCPRCNSINTKFCYYNNYSLSQPRFFCKSCRRYWTAGGSLRNIPIGGASRKNKIKTTSSSKKKDSIDDHMNFSGSPSITSCSYCSSLLSDMEPIPFMPMPVSDSDHSTYEFKFKPSFDVSGDGFEGRSLFGVEDLKQVSVMDSEGDLNGGKIGDLWNGFFGGGTW